MIIRYDDMRIDRLLIKEYQKQLETDLKRLGGLDDIEMLLGEFESIFSQYIGTKYCILVNSGSDALQLSLLTLGIGKGNSVIIPDVTYPAVPLAVIYTGADPIFVDVKEEDLQINENLIEKHLKRNTRAIVAAHMFAKPCNIGNILKIAKKHNLYVIEDCCQAESSGYKGRKLGSFGDLSCFSFSYYKPLSSCGGGGGAICFNDEKYKKLLDYTRVWNDDEALIQAGKRFARMYLLDLAAVKVKFKYLKGIIKSRLKIKEIYENTLSKIKEIRIFKDIENSISVPQNFVIFSQKREMLGKYLKSNGIIWQKPYTPLHLTKIFKRFSRAAFPFSEKYWKEALHLPLFSFMKEEEHLGIIKLIEVFFNKHIKKDI